MKDGCGELGFADAPSSMGGGSRGGAGQGPAPAVAAAGVAGDHPPGVDAEYVAKEHRAAV